MAIQKPSLPKGTRDFSPEEVKKRQYIFDKIRRQFQLFGYAPIETPSFENLSTLTGKYGEEGDRLIFKILDSGDFFKSKRESWGEYEILYKYHNSILRRLLNEYNSDIVFEDELNHNLSFIKDIEIVKRLSCHFKLIEGNIQNYISAKLNNTNNSYNDQFELFEKSLSLLTEGYVNSIVLNSKRSIPQISDKALRYDLTVPFARYVVQHQNEITFPFKRYQIQPVWRADRPQKGRFREFYQCDADVVGSDSLLQEVELISLYDAVFTDLNVGVEIHFNNRKVLSGLAEVAQIPDQLIDFTVALDKLDKIGEEKVKEEMLQKGISQQAIQTLSPLFSMKGNYQEQLNSLKNILRDSKIGMQGIEEIQFVFETTQKLGLKSSDLILNLTLARGLNYYTGAIMEVKAKNVELGSIGGGGRYDDLTGIFGLNGLSGVGISFGLDRIYLVIEELELFPKSIQNSLDVLFVNFGDQEAEQSMILANQLREKNVRCEVYPANAKIKKQMQYADKKVAKFVAIIGQEELNAQKVNLKNMISGEQVSLSFEELCEYDF